MDPINSGRHCGGSAMATDKHSGEQMEYGDKL